MKHGRALGPSWTGGTLVGAWPPFTPGLESSPAGVEDGVGRMANPF
jgi:hypothetical protein